MLRKIQYRTKVKKEISQNVNNGYIFRVVY